MRKRSKRFTKQFPDRPAAWFVCAGSAAASHAPLYFTPTQARRGCPHGCICPMLGKDRNRAVAK